MLFNGLYINLDESPARHHAMQARLKALGLDGMTRRFAGQRGDGRAARISASQLGCFLSHQAVLEQAPADRFTLVLEDDAALAAALPRRLPALLDPAQAQPWDILFLGQTVPYDSIHPLDRLIKASQELGDIGAPDFARFFLMDGAMHYVWGAFGYVVHPRALPRLRALLRQFAAHGYPTSWDGTLATLIKQGQLTARCLFPYLVGVDTGHDSTISGRGPHLQHQLHALLVNLFLADADEQQRLRAQALAFCPSATDWQAAYVSWLTYRKLSAPPDSGTSDFT